MINTLISYSGFVMLCMMRLSLYVKKHYICVSFEENIIKVY